MTRVFIRTWGRNLTIRVPLTSARSTGLTDGELLEIEALGGDILIRRSAARACNRQDAEQAAAEITANSKTRSLRDLSLRELHEEGRRG